MTEDYETTEKMAKTNIEINKLKIVLLALWDSQYHIEAQKLVEKFREDISDILPPLK